MFTGFADKSANPAPWGRGGSRKKHRHDRCGLTGTVPRSTVPDARSYFAVAMKSCATAMTKAKNCEHDERATRYRARAAVTGGMGRRTGTWRRRLRSAATIIKKPIIVAGGRKGVSDGRKLFSRKL